MKIAHKIFYPALSLSLMLSACSPEATFQLPTDTSQQQSPSTVLIPGAQQVNFTYTQPQDFKTQVVDSSALKFIKLTLVGDGVTGSLSNEGDFIAVTGGKATATINNVPIQAGKVRVVTVQGYDADKNPLPAFVGKGYYTSQSGQTSITITIDRQRLLTGLALEKLIASNPGKASGINVGALQAAIDEATGFNSTTKQFTTDPTLFDPQKLADQLANGTTPTKTELENTVQVAAGNVGLSLSTTGGGKFTEALTVEIDDPKSTAQTIALNASSPQIPGFQVSPGSWTLKVKKADGTVIGTTTVNVAANGTVTLGNASLTLTLKPEITSLTPNSGSTAGGTVVTLTGVGFTGATAVSFGSTQATSFTVNGNTQITATAPAAAEGVSNISVTTPGGSSVAGTPTQFTYSAAPVITSLSQTSGARNTSITINGSNFNSVHSNNIVKFGNTVATTVSGTSTSLVVTIPAVFAGAITVTVENSGQVSAEAAFNVGVLKVHSSGTPQNLYKTTKFLDSYIAVGNNGAIVSSSDEGNNWTAQVSGGTSNLSDIASDNANPGTVVAVGNGSAILFSTDGATWTPVNGLPPAFFAGVTHGNGTFVTVGSNGTIITSSNGITWTSRVSGVTGHLHRVSFANGNFFASGNNGALLRSTDNGVTWTAQTTGTTSALYGFAANTAGDANVVIGLTGTILSSPDGVNWTSRNSGTTKHLISVAYQPVLGIFVAVGDGGHLLTSEDGIIWSAEDTGTTVDLRGVYPNDVGFIVTGIASNLIFSTNYPPVRK